MVLSPGTETGAKVTNVQTLNAMNDKTTESVLNSPDKNIIGSKDIESNKQGLSSSATSIRSSAILQVIVLYDKNVPQVFFFIAIGWRFMNQNVILILGTCWQCT